MIKTILFDLDGTLLPMDTDLFTKTYFKGLCAKLYPYGYTDSEKLIGAIWSGTKAMVKNNDGIHTNEEAFWNNFATIYGENAKNDEPKFREFYENDFDKFSYVCPVHDKSKKLVDKLVKDGFNLVLSTNPIFPYKAQELRVKWTGIDPSVFKHITSYETSHFCKPNPKYFKEILDTLHLDPAECLMVGNDVKEDMVAASLGIKCFLLTDCLINKDNIDISIYPHGSFKELEEFIYKNR